jgi:hypothetical protein
MVTVISGMGPISHKARRLLIARSHRCNYWLGGAAYLSCRRGAAYRRPRPEPAQANAIVRDSASAWEPARTTAADGVMLDGWLPTARQPDGSGVILLHGVGDTDAGFNRPDAGRPRPRIERRTVDQLPNP